MPALDRRDFLKLLAGVPLAIGLPGSGWLFAGEEADGSMRSLLAGARRSGRPRLLVAVPSSVPGRSPLQVENYARRQRLARRLDELLSVDGTADRLLLAQLVVVVATESELRAAVAGLPETPDGAESSPLWLLSATDSVRLDAALDGDDAAAKRLLPALRKRLLGTGLETLRARSEAELAALDGPTRRRVDTAVADLASDDFPRRESATTFLAARRDEILATLAMGALSAEDPEVRARCARVAQPTGQVRPVGTEWKEFHGGCGRHDPYAEELSRIRCGRSAISPNARMFLHLTAGSS